MILQKKQFQDIRVDPSLLWKPDLLLYNSANENFDATFPTNIVVRSTGQCEQIPPGIFKSTCRIDITWFPFDDQDCDMKFGSWTYNGFKVWLSNEFLLFPFRTLITTLTSAPL